MKFEKGDVVYMEVEDLLGYISVIHEGGGCNVVTQEDRALPNGWYNSEVFLLFSTDDLTLISRGDFK